jgi:shikimate dehydrogenase
MNVPYAEVIGDPIAHSKSPLIHRFWLEKLGLDGDYRALRVPSDGLADYFAARRADPAWRGCNVTVPHKQAVAPYLDGLGPIAAAVGAVNLVFYEGERLLGGNSDVAGVHLALPRSVGQLQTACLIGSGGAALAALAAFPLIGISEVGLNVRNQAKGRDLLAATGLKGRVGPVDDRANLAAAQLILNASTLGMAGQDPMPASVLARIEAISDDTAIVFDMVYAPLETELLKAARRRGLRTVDGLKMLVAQARTVFEAFYGAPAPRQHDEELRQLLTS